VLDGLTKKAEPPPTRDVNRDSGTDSANGSGERLCEKSVMFFETFTPEDGLIQA
jgi:hypothetical protein